MPTGDLVRLTDRTMVIRHREMDGLKYPTRIGIRLIVGGIMNAPCDSPRSDRALEPSESELA